MKHLSQFEGYDLFKLDRILTAVQCAAKNYASIVFHLIDGEMTIIKSEEHKTFGIYANEQYLSIDSEFEHTEIDWADIIQVSVIF